MLTLKLGPRSPTSNLGEGAGEFLRFELDHSIRFHAPPSIEAFLSFHAFPSFSTLASCSRLMLLCRENFSSGFV